MRSLYITYDGLLDPLGQSQVIPYLKRLNGLRIGTDNNETLKFIVLSFEKQKKLKEKARLERIRQELNSAGIDWTSLKYHKFPPVLSTVYDIFIGVLVSSFILKKNRVAIIHARAHVSALIAYVLKKFFRVKFLFDMRGFYIEERFIDGNMWREDSLIYKITKFMEKKFLKNADSMVILTKTSKAYLEENDFLKGKKGFKIEVIPTCTDLNHFNIKDRASNVFFKPKLNNNFILFYGGSVSSLYMLDKMIDFFALLKKHITNAHFIICAKEGDAEIAKMIKTKKLMEDDFTVVDTTYDAIPTYISCADLAMSFRKQRTSFRGSCPTKLGESLASGVPIIVNAGIGDFDEIIKKNRVGIVIDNFSEESFLRGIDELNNILREDKSLLRNRCREVAKKYFSVDDGAKKYFKIYQFLAK